MSNQYRDLALQLRGFTAGLGRPCTLLDDAADLLEVVGSAGVRVDLAIVAQRLKDEYGIEAAPKVGGYDEHPHLNSTAPPATLSAALGEPEQDGCTDVWTFRGVQLRRWNMARYDATHDATHAAKTADTDTTTSL